MEDQGEGEGEPSQGSASLESRRPRGVQFNEKDEVRVISDDTFAAGSVGVGSLGDFKTHSQATPKIRHEQLEYRKPSERTGSKEALACEQGSIVKPNYEDMLRRVSIVLQQHISKCEERLKKARESQSDHLETGLFHSKQAEKFNEEHFISPQHMYHFVRAPICRIGFVYGIREVEKECVAPTTPEVHQFLSDLFIKAQLSAECSIVCLIYIERLMEIANVPLLKNTWRIVTIGGMLLASKVWQDLSSWNIEFSQVYPQYNIQSINRIERLFCSEISWNLYISQSVYAKYYFALRSLNERKKAKNDFRQNFVMTATNAPGAQEISAGTDRVKSELLQTVLSKSL